MYPNNMTNINKIHFFNFKILLLRSYVLSQRLITIFVKKNKNKRKTLKKLLFLFFSTLCVKMCNVCGIFNYSWNMQLYVPQNFFLCINGDFFPFPADNLHFVRRFSVFVSDTLKRLRFQNRFGFVAIADPSPSSNSTYCNAIKNARRNVRCRMGRPRDVGEKRHEPVTVDTVTIGWNTKTGRLDFEVERNWK